MRHLLRQWASTFLIALIVLGPTQNVFAQELSAENKEEFTRLTAEANGLFEAEKYDEAASSFLKAYEIKPVSNILYNVARIYEKAGNMEKALQYYQDFVKSPNVEQEARQDALDRIKTLREVLALDKKPSEEVKEELTPAPSPDYTLAYVFWGTGGAALISSGVFALLASGTHSNFQNATDLEEKRSFADSGETYALVADSLLITGAVLGVLGTVFFFTADSGESDDGGVTIAPIIGADRVGLGMTFGF